MKKSLLLLLCVLLCATLLMAACTPTETPDPGKDPGTEETPGTGDGGNEGGDGEGEEPELDKNGKMTYKAYVKDQNGDPVVGALLNFCIDDLCMPSDTNADGLAKNKYLPGTEVHVAINTLPDGYTAETIDYYLGGTNPTEITITVTKTA